MLRNAAKHIRAIVAREDNQMKVRTFIVKIPQTIQVTASKAFSFFSLLSFSHLTSSYIDKCFYAYNVPHPIFLVTGQTRVNHHQETELPTASQ